MSEETVETDEISYTDKQDYLIRFGYDPTNVKYMNTDILNQAYTSAKNIEAIRQIVWAPRELCFLDEKLHCFFRVLIPSWELHDFMYIPHQTPWNYVN